MLQDFRDNLSGVTKGVLVVIITIPFVFFGVDALFETRPTEKEVANVNGDSISAEVFPKGTSIITYFTEDASNNVDSCKQDVTVEDVEEPTITCP